MFKQNPDNLTYEFSVEDGTAYYKLVERLASAKMIDKVLEEEGINADEIVQVHSLQAVTIFLKLSSLLEEYHLCLADSLLVRKEINWISGDLDLGYLQVVGRDSLMGAGATAEEAAKELIFKLRTWNKLLASKDGQYPATTYSFIRTHSDNVFKSLVKGKDEIMMDLKPEDMQVHLHAKAHNIGISLAVVALEYLPLFAATYLPHESNAVEYFALSMAEDIILLRESEYPLATGETEEEAYMNLNKKLEGVKRDKAWSIGMYYSCYKLDQRAAAALNEYRDYQAAIAKKG